MLKIKLRTGFTLLEILLTVAAISVLSSITIVAINPNKQIADSRDSVRLAHVKEILNAVYQYQLDTGLPFNEIAPYRPVDPSVNRDIVVPYDTPSRPMGRRNPKPVILGKGDGRFRNTEPLRCREWCNDIFPWTGTRNTQAQCFDLRMLQPAHPIREEVLVSDYLSDIPRDPLFGWDKDEARALEGLNPLGEDHDNYEYYTGYYIYESPNGRLIVGACHPEGRDENGDPVLIELSR